ncbi:MAG: transporter substrate-binding domain-containing protein [Chloroflexota bacterium]|nr:transporter substrate-binding domain-containing protein [Chloroflexota bacterium]
MREGRSASIHSRVGLLLVVMVTAGCGGTVGSPSADASATQTASIGPGRSTEPSPGASGLEAELVTAGRLTYCTNLRPGRMGFLDENGEPAGVNIELAQEIAVRLGLEAEIRETPFEDLIDDVADGACDMSISSQHITQTRLGRIDMLPYTQGVQHVVVQAGNPAGIVQLTDLCGKILAVQTGSTHVDLVLGQGDHSGAGIDRDCAAAGQPKVDLLEFDDDADAIEALADGSADAYIGSDTITVDRPAEFDLATPLPPIRNGIGLPKDHPALQAAVGGVFQAMIDDGTYQAILEQFGVGDNSIAN